MISSYILYISWAPWFLAILLSSTLMNFLIGKWLRRTPTAPFLWVGIIPNIAILGAFKYLPELAIHLPYAPLQKFAHLALPLGISFWTFQAISYLFDLYRGEELDPSLAEFALYMSFFPVTISGPICRMPEMLPQFRSQQLTAWSDIQRGLQRIAMGGLMMQLARLLGQGIFGGEGIDFGFDRATVWSGPDVWCLTLGYGLQLFFDFAGYSHIAIGAAQILGFTVPENFARPFQSTTPSVFWTRWHMSLSFWVRDYVFLPLAVMRREVWWRNLALVMAMVIFGLWHKATILLLIWGAYHGVLLVLHRQVQQMERRFGWELSGSLWSAISWLLTMALINLGWVFFRAASLPQAREMLLAVISPENYGSQVLSGSLYALVFVLALGYGAVVAASEALDRNEARDSNTDVQVSITARLARTRWYWIPALYALAFLVIVMLTLTQGGGAAQLMYRGF